MQGAFHLPSTCAASSAIAQPISLSYSTQARPRQYLVTQVSLPDYLPRQSFSGNPCVWVAQQHQHALSQEARGLNVRAGFRVQGSAQKGARRSIRNSRLTTRYSNGTGSALPLLADLPAVSITAITRRDDSGVTSRRAPRSRWAARFGYHSSHVLCLCRTVISAG